MPGGALQAVSPEILSLWGRLLEGAADTPADPGVPMCGACGSQAFQDLTPPGACGLLRLLKCLRCSRRWLVAGDKISA
jgi:hypothetical protein